MSKKRPYYQSPIRIGGGPCEEGFSRCHECGECKSDPDEFYDGLICKVCAETEEPLCENCDTELLSVEEEMHGLCDACNAELEAEGEV